MIEPHKHQTEPVVPRHDTVLAVSDVQYLLSIARLQNRASAEYDMIYDSIDNA
jgi:hypothetical protein